MKDDEGRTTVSGSAALGVGLSWVLGSVLLGYLTAGTPDWGRRVEQMLAWAAVGALPAVIVVLMLSHDD